jgi:SAM-dependent methyltransferase/uncharacterized protein YbaR (Trm112 family)
MEYSVLEPSVRADLPSELPLVCPACRAMSPRGWEMHTVALVARFAEEGGAVLQGLLECVNCAHKYPILHGIPVIVPHLGELLRTEALALAEGEIAPELASLLAADGPDGEPIPRLYEHVSTYADAHWGDRAEPPPDGPGAPFGYAAIAERLRARAAAPVGRAVELGCGLGRGLAELSRGARLVVGIELAVAPIRRARRLLAGGDLAYARRVAGRSYRAVRVPGLPTANVALVCGDALDPPIPPAHFDRVVAVNLLDNVRSPPTLLSVLDGLCAPGGEVILGSPYAWQSGIVDEEGRLGGAAPAARVRDIFLRGEGLSGPYAVEEEADLRWWLRRDARSAVAYDVHYLRCRKRA